MDPKEKSSAAPDDAPDNQGDNVTPLADVPLTTSEEAAKQPRDSWQGTVRLIVTALLLAIGVRSFAFEPFSIPSESMLPTLLVGDYIFVSKYPYGYSRHSFPFSPPLFSGRVLADEIERGDVIVFKLPRDRRTNYIKRVIGLPGDQIQVVDGILFINGTAVQKEATAPFVVDRADAGGCFAERFVVSDSETIRCRYPRYVETLPGGRQYQVLDLQDGSTLDNTRIFEVPDGHYFMMGDNRDNSEDSRRTLSVGVGYVPEENIVGRAEMVFYSSRDAGNWYNPLSWFSGTRTDRLFKDVQ